MTDKTENIVKATAKRLGMTYKQLGEEIGYSDEAVGKSASSGKLSTQMQKAIELFLLTIEQKEQLQTVEDLKNTLHKLLS